MGRREQPDRYLLERARLAGELALVRWLNAGLAGDDDAVVDEAPPAMRSLAYRLGADALARRVGLSGARRCCGSRRTTSSPAGARPAATTRTPWPAAWPRWTPMSLRCKRSTTSSPDPGERDQLADLVAALGAGGEPWTGHFLPTLLGTPGLTRTWRPATPDSRRAPAQPAYGIALVTRLPVHGWHSLRLDVVLGPAADAGADTARPAGAVARAGRAARRAGAPWSRPSSGR